MGSKHNSLSILIPAYNAESTISRCLDSIINQPFDAIEVVLIDDGSTDKTYKLISEYAEKYPFIKVFLQENSGVSATRQSLVEKATGDYIMFCDADDYFEPDAIKTVFEMLDAENEKLDLIIFGYNLVRTTGTKTVKRRKLKPGIYSYDKIAKNHVRGFSDLYWSALWNKCYKRDLFFEPDKVVFEHLMEDVICNVDVISRAHWVCISDIVIYDYVQIGVSLTRKNASDSSESINDAYNTFETLKNKALYSYPRYEEDIYEYMYERIWSLKKRSGKIGESILFCKFATELEQYKKYKRIRHLYLYIRKRLIK